MEEMSDRISAELPTGTRVAQKTGKLGQRDPTTRASSMAPRAAT
jgi:hypothetical protein